MIDGSQELSAQQAAEYKKLLELHGSKIIVVQNKIDLAAKHMGPRVKPEDEGEGSSCSSSPLDSFSVVADNLDNEECLSVDIFTKLNLDFKTNAFQALRIEGVENDFLPALILGLDPGTHSIYPSVSKRIIKYRQTSCGS